MKLYIWPPAFSLTSIDPECIAALEYIKRYPTRKSCTVEYTQDPSRSPTGDLPLLECSCGEKVTGFNAIVSHLDREGLESSHSDQPGRQPRKTDWDSRTLCSFIRSLGQPLLDLYLYVSYENYYHTTSAEWTKCLHWATNYIIPGAKRRLARARVAHLGINSLDLDTVHDNERGRFGQDNIGAGTAKVGTGSMESLLAQQSRLKALLKGPQHADAFRLEALADSFLGPLDDKLEQHGRPYLCGAQPGSADCLAYGYLGLMLVPSVPRRWLAETIEKRYPRLLAYFEKLRAESDREPRGGGAVVAYRTLELPNSDAWKMVVAAVLETLPFNPLASAKIAAPTTEQSEEGKSSDQSATSLLSPALWSASLLAAAVIAGVSYAFHLHESNSRYQDKQEHVPSGFAPLPDPGEARDLLSALRDHMEVDASRERERERMGGAIISEAELVPDK